MTPSIPGRIETIVGPMFSGKSEELIRRLKRARIARQRVACYKPEDRARDLAKEGIMASVAFPTLPRFGGAAIP